MATTLNGHRGNHAQEHVMLAQLQECETAPIQHHHSVERIVQGLAMILKLNHAKLSHVQVRIIHLVWSYHTPLLSSVMLCGELINSMMTEFATEFVL